MISRPWHDHAPGQPRIILWTWNMLADGLAESGGFIRSPAESLSWQRPDGRGRGARILAQLEAGVRGEQQPDIFCLQEVDRFAALRVRLEAWGYAGCFEPKRPGRDGLCLFVRRARFALADVEVLRYRNPDGSPQGQLALIARLAGKAGLPSLRVASTHLKAKAAPESQAQRVQQCAQLRDRLERLDAEEPLPLLLAGDFNAPPASPEIESLRGRSLGLRSVAPTPGGDQPAWTTWKVRVTGEVRRVIDYVWYGPGLRWLGGLGLPEPGALPATGLPCWEYPSDHLHLCHAFAPVDLP